MLPLKYFIDLVNAVYLHGHGVWTQPEALAVLAAWGVAGLVFTTFRFPGSRASVRHRRMTDRARA